VTHEPFVPSDGKTLTESSSFAGNGPVTSVLICDDRPAVLQGWLMTLRSLPGVVDIDWVPNGFALLDAFETKQADLVLIGVHSASSAGHEAIGLLLGMHPSTSTTIYGSLADIDILSAAYARGAASLLLWEPQQWVDLGAQF
jgi:DNA-binding NarL/FixJ family response regulator